MSQTCNLGSREINYNITHKDKIDHIRVNNKNKYVTMANNLTMPLYTVLMAMPNFTGDNKENIESFLYNFDELAKATYISDAIKLLILKTKISGKAKEIIENTDISNEKSYQNLKDKLIQEFKTQKNFAQLQNDFISLKQNPTK